MRKALALSLVLLAIIGTVGFLQPTAGATTAGFRPGQIMDDVVMTKSNSMSISQIQNFLNSKVPTCDTNGLQQSEMINAGVPDYNGNGSIQRWEWGKAKYNQTKFPCLKDYPQNNKKAAQIIYETAQKYTINPQTLIVLLQKEQGLVTDTWPLNIQYRSATGYGCPDTAPCDSQYYGLTNQLDWAAKMYRSILNQSPDWYSPYFKGVNPTVYWHPDTGRCGSQPLDIKNWTTAGLYSYTPYRPNQASLNAGYGTGDSCSSYGNRNFYSYFTDWFGATGAPSFAAQQVRQSANPTIAPTQAVSVFIEMRNMGNQTWYDDTTAASNGKKPIHLATASPINRTSSFEGGGWLSNNRPTGTFNTVFGSDGVQYSTNPHVVKPGESARFEFTLTVPDKYQAGSYREVFTLVEEGGSGILPMPVSPWIDITVPKIMSTSHVTQLSHPTLRPGEVKQDAYITYENTGNVNWYDNLTASKSSSKPIRLATMNPLNRSSIFGDSSWGSGKNRPTGIFETVYKANGEAYPTNPHIVKPGESAKFKFNITVPENNTPGTYREYLSIIEEGGVGTIETPIIAWTDITTTNSATAQPITNSYQHRIAQTNTLTQTYSFKNTGTIAWNSGVELRVISGNTAGVDSDSWPSSTTAASLNEASVAPGETGSFTVTYKASGDVGQHPLEFAPFISGASIALKNLNVNIVIEKPDYTAAYYNQSSYPTMLQNSTQETFFRFKNIGNVTWYDTTSSASAGAKPVVLASTSPINRISRFGAAFDRTNRASTTFSRVFAANGSTLTANPHEVKPGEIVEFRFNITAPDNLAPGTYKESFQPIVEGGNPWSMTQVAWTNIHVLNSSNVAKFYSQSAFPVVNRGTSANSYFVFKNIGNSTWYDTSSAPRGIRPVTLAATNPINRLSNFRSGFATSNRASIRFAAVYEADGTSLASNQEVVKPGQIVRFNFAFSAPVSLAPGTYKESFQPIVEGGNPWSMTQVAWLYVTVH